MRNDRLRGLRRRRRLVDRSDRQADHEACASSDPRFDRERAPVLLAYDPIRDRQSLPRAFADFLRREERIEDSIAIASRTPEPSSFDSSSRAPDRAQWARE
jgi:hypothetical protein